MTGAILGWVIVAILGFFCLWPVLCMAFAWSWYAWRSRHPYAAARELPKVNVILSLRGADPSLEACLTGLLAQDYPAYAVHIVIDSAADPAWQVMSKVLARGHAPHIQVDVAVREEQDERCGLKLSAQRQVLKRLDDRNAVVVFIDADTAPAANWLRAMVAPLADPKVGIASGVRWSAPVDRNSGTLTRFVFNAYGFSQMLIYRIPWGGSLAIRADVLREAGLVDRWSRCLCEDTSSYGPVRKLGLRVAFVPAATQVSCESIDLAGSNYFMLRQIVCVRLHHVFWRRLFAVAIATAVAVVLCGLLASLGIVGAVVLLSGAKTELWKLTAFAAFPALGWAGAVGLVAIADRLVRRLAAEPPHTIRFADLVWATPLALYNTAYATIAAPLTRSIDWRGITYDIEDADQIRMRAFQPYRTANGERDATSSLL